MKRFVLALVLGAWAIGAQSADYQFTLVADTTGAFSDVAVGSINDSGAVIFRGQTTSGRGIYEYTSSGLSLIAHVSGEFSSFGIPIGNNVGTVAFSGTRDSGETGVYAITNGAVTTIVDNSGDFDSFSSLSLNDLGAAAFRAFKDSGAEGVYSGSGGALTTIADPTGPLGSFGYTSINGSGTVAFGGSGSGSSGVYTGSGGALTTIVELASSVGRVEPGPSINDDGTVVATKNISPDPSSQADAIVTGNGGTLTVIVAESDGEFDSLGIPVINNEGLVAFVGQPEPGGITGIFAGPDPFADKVILEGDEIDGLIFDDLQLFADGLLNDQGQIVFQASMSNGHTAIYLATPIPIPAAAWLFGSALGLLGWMRRRVLP